MRVIKLALLSFFFLFLVVTVISLFIPSHIRISKATNIHGRDKDKAFSAIQNRESWPQWHPLFMEERNKNIKTRFLFQNDSAIVVQMSAANRKPVISGWQIHRYSQSDSVTLQWYLDFHLKWYPWQKFGSILYEDSYGKMMEEGLEKLKKISVAY